MPEDVTFLIVGAGLAGAKAAESLREEGFDGRIVLIGEETERPYERPPLSKGYLLGTAERDTIYVHPETWYAEHDVDLRLGTTVAGIDPTGHQVTLADGTRLGYTKLLLATGSSPRRLRVPGADQDGVLYLRRAQDSDQIKQTLQSASRVAVVGGGWIGLEVTAAARAAGVEVTLLEAARLPLLAVLGPEVAQVFADLHREHGVDARFGAQVAEITGAAGRADGVRLADGARIDGRRRHRGNRHRAQHPARRRRRPEGGQRGSGRRAVALLRPGHLRRGRRRQRLPPFARPVHPGRALGQRPQPAEDRGQAMLGREVAYDRVPYFFTDQYDLGMEYSGYVEPGGYDQVVFRGDVAGREFVAFWLAGGRVLAGMNVNVWDVTDPIQALVRSRARVDPAALADPAIPLADLAGG